MPRLSRWFLGAAVIYLLSGTAAGAGMMAAPALGIQLPSWMLPLHIEFMLVGWAVELAMGMAYWILPRHKTGAGRGNESLAWGSFGLLNAGVLAAALGGIGDPRATLATAGHLAELAAAGAFAFNAWRRLPRSISPAGRSLPVLER